MFDKKIQEIVDQLGEAFNEKADILVGEVCKTSDYTRMTVDKWSKEFEVMSKQTKIGIGVALGLGVIDTALLFAILIKLGR